jgi:flagellin
VNSILNNSAALSALQSLNMTQSALSTTQNQVSSGLAVANASDNAAYWSISTQLGSDNTITVAANSAISQSQAVLDTATTAINQIITTIGQIQTALTDAVQPGANLTNISTSLSSYGLALTDAVNSAYFNGINVLDGTANSSGTVSFVSGFYAANSGSLGTVSLGSTTVSTLFGLGLTTISLSLETVYSASSNTANTNGAGQAPASGSSLLYAVGTTASAGTYDLTQLGSSVTTSTTQTALEDMLTAVNSALTNVTNYAATIGATQDRLSALSNLNSALSTNYSDGIAGLVDADMNTASTRLQALQTQEQLGIQALSIANQNAQLILKLFP